MRQVSPQPFRRDIQKLHCLRGQSAPHHRVQPAQRPRRGFRLSALRGYQWMLLLACCRQLLHHSIPGCVHELRAVGEQVCLHLPSVEARDVVGLQPEQQPLGHDWLHLGVVPIDVEQSQMRAALQRALLIAVLDHGGELCEDGVRPA
jgi:hypothetical protein